MKYEYYCNCVNWPRDDVHVRGGLCDMIDSGRYITRETFRRNVGGAALQAFESEMGYPMGRLTMAKDWAVSYSRGVLHGRRVYWVNHSGIEYVFTSA
jgi:hypothetical protein